MKKLLVLFVALAFAGNAFAAQKIIDVTITVDPYLVVTGDNVIATHANPEYDATGHLTIGTDIFFKVSSNAAWSGSLALTNDWVVWDGNNNRNGLAGWETEVGFGIQLWHHISQGRVFSTVATFTVN